MGTTGGLCTPLRRRVGVNSSLAAAPAVTQPSPTASLHAVSLLDTTDPAGLMDAGSSCGASSVATCPMDLGAAPTSRSFDPFPSMRGQSARRLLPPREAKSLEDCCIAVVAPTPSPPAAAPLLLANGRLGKHESDESVCSQEGTPLIPPKRWRSLVGAEAAPLAYEPTSGGTPPLDAKHYRGSLKTWLVGFLNGNGLKGSHSANASQTSLRKNVYSLPSTMAAAATNPSTFPYEQTRLPPKSNDESIV